MPSKLNGYLLKELSGEMQDVSHGIFVDFTGLNARESNALRGRLLKSALRIQVIKNRVAKLAFQTTLQGDINQILKGPIAVIFGNPDPVTSAKIVLDNISSSGKLKLRGGFIDGKTLNIGDVERLAKMPSKLELMARILGSVQSPASNLVYGMEAVFRQFNFGGVATQLAGLFEAYHQKLKEKQGS